LISLEIIAKIIVCEKSVLHANPWLDQNSSKTVFFLNLGWFQTGPHEKLMQSRNLINQNPSVNTGAMIDLKGANRTSVPNLLLVQNRPWRKEY